MPPGVSMPLPACCASMASPFADLPLVTPDPVFELMRLAKTAGPDGIDGTVGMILSEEGLPLAFDCLRQAAKEWAEEGFDDTLPYPPLLGLPTFRECVERLIFANDTRNMASLATTGGTGALAINLMLARALDPTITVILPMPTWGNHKHLVRTAGLRMEEVPYLVDGEASADGIVEALGKAKGRVVLLLQSGCHNPTGKDLDMAQWELIADMASERDAIILLDMPYQGFGGEPEDDANVPQLLRAKRVALLIAWSGAKNHAAYGLRVGLACGVGRDEAEAGRISDQYAVLTRGIHSAASTAGQWIVARVQERHADAWRTELRAARETIDAKRAKVRRLLPTGCAVALDGNGLFALLPLGEDKVRTLRGEKKIFLTGDGRVNIAGLGEDKLERFAEAIGKAI
jgi:aspartate aminotransferase